MRFRKEAVEANDSLGTLNCGVPPEPWTFPMVTIEASGSEYEQAGYSAESKSEAVKQIIDRKYSVKEVLERLGISTHSCKRYVLQILKEYYFAERP